MQYDPPESYRNNFYIIEEGKEPMRLGMFIWSWQYHNKVNVRLGKKGISWQEAYQKFKRHESSCTSVCKRL